MSDLTTGRIPGTPADLQQPLPAVENDRPVANRETPRETTAAELRAEDDRCVVCALSPTRHGGLCCAHRYDEQPRCAECPPDTAATVRCVCGAGCDFSVPDGWKATPPARQVTCMDWPRGQEPEWFRRLAGGRYV